MRSVYSVPCMLLFILLLFVVDMQQLYAAQACTSTQYDEHSKVRYVHDGDTLHLVDGRKIRLIGINTPELEHDEKPAEPFAGEARNALMSLFRRDKSIALVYGKDKKDRYGRILAHAFLPDGQNVQAELLRQGMANAINVPPNTRFSACYLEIENTARCSREGLWNAALVLEAKNLKQQNTGFHLVKGKVEAIETTKKGIWLNIDNRLTVGIRPEDQAQFDIEGMKKIVDQPVMVRGWINRSNRSRPFYLRLRHPLSLQLLSSLSCDEQAQNQPRAE